MASEPAKRTSFPHSVAATMKRQLDRKQDGEIGYTIQQVSRYRLEDIRDAFKPLSPDLAQWFTRIAKDNNSPGFAIKEMYRIVTYTDMIWPEMKAAIDECKDQILPMILKLIRDKHEEEAGRYVKMLKDLEITWPELRVISGSLLESIDEADDLPGLVRPDLSHYSEEEQIAAVKRYPPILHNFPNATDLVKRAAIETNPRAIGMVDDPSEELQLLAVGKSLFALRDIKNPTNKVAWMAINKHAASIGDLSNPDAEMQMHAVSKQPELIKNIKHPTPEVQIEAFSKEPRWMIGKQHLDPVIWKDIDVKNAVMRYVLTALKDNDPLTAKDMIDQMTKHGCDWPELEVLAYSTDVELDNRPLDEAGGNPDDDEEHDGEDFEYSRAWRAKLEYQEFLKDLRHDIETQSWDLAALDLIDIGMTEIEDVLPDRTKQLIEQNKDNLIRGILERMKVGRYMEMTIHAVDGLNNMGFNWPELRVIRNSLTSDSKKDQT